MSFVKLDAGLLTSSLWIDRGSRDVFITALLMAVPKKFSEPQEALKTRAIEPLGFTVPPGEFGFVAAAGPGIVRMALLDQDEGMLALETLANPDPDSRTALYDGRRLVRVNGGYIVLNYMKFRDKDHTAAARMRAMRDRQRTAKDEITSNVTSVTSQTVTVTQAEAEAEEELKRENKERKEKRASRSRPPRKTTLPEGFSVSDRVKDWAQAQGHGRLDEHLDAFRRKAAAKGYEYVDWDAAFMEAIRENWAKLNASAPAPSNDDWMRRVL